MATTIGIADLTEQIFDRAGLALDASFAERVRRLGDSSCRAGIEAAVTYLCEKSELSEAELQMLSAGTIPDHIKQARFDAHIEGLKAGTHPRLTDNDRAMCRDAFDSGLSAAICHLLKTAKTQKADLLSVLPSKRP